MVETNIDTNDTMDRISSAFKQGFESIYGLTMPCCEAPRRKSLYINKYGAYTILQCSNIEEDIGHYAYELGEQAARSILYNKRKSIRLGRIYNIQVLYKYDPLLWMFNLPTLGWKATMNVSKEERRAE